MPSAPIQPALAPNHRRSSSIAENAAAHRPSTAGMRIAQKPAPNHCDSQPSSQ
jgi:hypothetical protein